MVGKFMHSLGNAPSASALPRARCRTCPRETAGDGALAWTELGVVSEYIPGNSPVAESRA